MKRALILSLVTFLWNSCADRQSKIDKIVLVSANAEWKVIKEIYPDEEIQQSPWGEYFLKELHVGSSNEKIIFFHGGWGKVAAAGSTQFCVDHWNPSYVINLGTCGGFEGVATKFQTILVNKTVIYDIREAMGDASQAIDDYSTTIDLSWLGDPVPDSVTKTLMVSADKDIVPEEIPELESRYGAIAGDWETGAIAYTCARNKKRVLILRGVTDLVSVEKGGEAYQNNDVFVSGTATVMKKLVKDLPLWLEKCK